MVVYKFVRVDGVEYKVDLQPGKYTIGRGKFLLSGANDKRVSRDHAELEVTDKAVTITSLNVNPCFYKRKGKVIKETLLRNHSISLRNGDRFAVLPEKYWFELLVSVNEDEQQNCTVAKDNAANGTVSKNKAANGIITKNKAANGTTSKNKAANGTITKNNAANDTVTNNNAANGTITKNNTANDTVTKNNAENGTVTKNNADNGSVTKNNADKADKTVNKDNTTNKLVITSNNVNTNESNATVTNKRSQDSILDSANLTQIYDNAVASTSSGSVKTPTKRPHCAQDKSLNDTTKKQKTVAGPNRDLHSLEGFVNLMTYIAKEFVEPDDPGPSGSQDGATNDHPSGQASIRENPRDGPLRERCMYAANCYRINAAHRAEYSHPEDADWAADQRGACADGAKCRRRLAAHWRQYRHPPSARPPATYTPGTKVVRQNGNVYYINARTVYINEGEVEPDEENAGDEEASERDGDGSSDEYSD